MPGVDRLIASCLLKALWSGVEFPGRWRAHRWCMQHVALFGDRPARRIQMSEFDFLVEPRPNFDIYLTGITRNTPVERFIRAYVKQGASTLDIGANLGWTTRLMSALVGTKGHVHAFEPIPSAYANLLVNIAAAPCKNITPHPVAVADYCGKLELFLASGDVTALATVRAPGAGESATSHTVDVITIDSLLNEVSHVDFVKIDVEGAEYKVLLGMQALIARDHPILTIELSDAWLAKVGSSARELIHFLTERGYAISWLDGDRIVPLTSVPAEQVDVVCVPAARS